MLTFSENCPWFIHARLDQNAAQKVDFFLTEDIQCNLNMAANLWHVHCWKYKQWEVEAHCQCMNRRAQDGAVYFHQGVLQILSITLVGWWQKKDLCGGATEKAIGYEVHILWSYFQPLLVCLGNFSSLAILL